MGSRKLIALALALLIGLGGGFAWAQDEPPPPPVGSPSPAETPKAKPKKEKKAKPKKAEKPEVKAEPEAAPAEEPEEEPQTEAAEDPQEGGAKELNFAGTPYPYYGSDTGLGFGFSIMFRDLFDKEGRDATFTAGLTESGYQYYSVNWGEPVAGGEKGRVTLSAGYDQQIGVRFFGTGNYADVDDVSYWANVKRNAGISYVYRFPRTEAGVVGVSVGLSYSSIEPTDMKLDEDVENDIVGIKRRFPEVYKSELFDPAENVSTSFGIYLDARKDRFPLGGGREEVVYPLNGSYWGFSYGHSDEALGSTFTYSSYTLDGRVYFPVISEDTIIAARGVATVMDGTIPFYSMTAPPLRGYYGTRWVDQNMTAVQVELRQGIAPDWQLSILDGALKAYYPNIVIFWEEGRVYSDFEDIPEEIGEDYHYTWGFGIRILVTPTIVIRAEYGISNEQRTTTLTAGLPF